MIKVVALRAEHVLALRDEGALTYLTDQVTDEKLSILERTPNSFTAISAGGKVLGCAGAIEIWSGRAEAWAFLSPSIGSDFVAVHRAVKRFLEIVPIRRIEAVVDSDFAPGHRWIKMLGFQREAECMRKYNVKGEDAMLYSLIKETP